MQNEKAISVLLISIMIISACSFTAFADETVIFYDGFEQGLDNWTFWDKVSKTDTKISDYAYSDGGNNASLGEGFLII